MKNFEIVKFDNGDFELDVNVSPREDTVWLSLKELCTLYGRDKSVISRHINNIFKEKELDRGSTVAKNAHVQFEGNRKIKREIEFFNLDVIISLGYRVHSKNGVIFRKWANRILKDYLIKGFVINPKKVEITIDDWNALNNRLSYLETKTNQIENNLFKEPLKDQIFSNGEFYDAYAHLSGLLKLATNDVVVIDSYFDLESLKILKSLKSKIRIDVYTSLNKMRNDQAIVTFKKQYPNFNIHISSIFHDRFLIIDKKRCFQIGTSLNSIGNKIFSILEIHDKEQIEFLINKICQIPNIAEN